MFQEGPYWLSLPLLKASDMLTQARAGWSRIHQEGSGRFKCHFSHHAWDLYSWPQQIYCDPQTIIHSKPKDVAVCQNKHESQKP